MTNIRVGIVGCGGRGRGHMRVLQTFDDVILTAVCDPFATSRDQAGTEFGVARRYATVEAMLDAEDLDAVVVATPAHLNAPSALPCLARGIDTLLEKPPGLSLDETHALKEAAAQSGARGMVGWNRRFDPHVNRVRREVGARGPVYQLVGEFHKSMSGFIASGRFPEHMMDNFLFETPIHSIDLVRHLAAAPVTEVHSYVHRVSAYKDVHAALVIFANGCVAQISANYTTDARLERYEIHGRDISAYLEGIHGGEFVCDGERRPVEPEGPDSTLAQARYFVDCVKENRPIAAPAADLDEAVATMELAVAIMDGLREN